MAFLLGFIADVNFSNPQTRKDSAVDSLEARGYGLSALSLMFAITWTFGYFAHVREPDLERLDFYPIFQLLNSWVGAFILFFAALPDRRFNKYLRPSCSWVRYLNT